MFKLGDHVGVKLREECHYGIICDVDEANSAVSIAIGTDRVAQVRVTDCFYDEGYEALKEGKYS